MKLALKIDVDTHRGTREGVPRLIDVLRRHGASASFLFSLGPDHTGRAVQRVFRRSHRGFMGKVARTSVLRHYGLRTLLYGTLLPGPDIGRDCAQTMRAAREAGFDTGIHCWDHVRWQDRVADADAAWTAREFGLAAARYADIFGMPARGHGAAGWQTNRHAARFEEEAGMRWASDTRGRGPFLPRWNGVRAGCLQLPTTLPTLDELIGLDGVTENTVAARVLALTRPAPESCHVFTLHAELEGGLFLPAFETLLAGWREQGYDLVSLDALARMLDPASLPAHEVLRGSVAGRAGLLALQGD